MRLDVDLCVALRKMHNLAYTYVEILCDLHLKNFRCERARELRKDWDLGWQSTTKMIHTYWKERAQLDPSTHSTFEEMRDLTKKLARDLAPLHANARDTLALMKRMPSIQPAATVDAIEVWIEHVAALPDDGSPVAVVDGQDGCMQFTAHWMDTLEAMAGVLETIDVLRAQSEEPTQKTLQ